MPSDLESYSVLRGAYATLDASRPLDDDVLTAFVFGSDSPCPQDSRCVRIDLAPMAGSARSEVWRGRGSVSVGTTGPIHYAHDGNFFVGWISIDEGHFGGLLEATESAYLRLLGFHADSHYQHVWRVWNYIAAINEGAGDDERYRQFCLGRARAFTYTQGRLPDIGYPAASAVGKKGGPNSLDICWIAGREAGSAIENPRQVSAYHYPRQYGPAAPSFSRAMIVPDQLLLISGTASIVGHASLHSEDLHAQLRETLMNLDALLKQAQSVGHVRSPNLGQKSLVKAYVRNPRDTGTVERAVRTQFGEAVPILVLAADICRSELLVEIELAHRD
jgi:chorismate lyase/3-hydroxybenzoate synthase